MHALRTAARTVRRDVVVRTIARLLLGSTAVVALMHPVAIARWSDAGPWAIGHEHGMLSVLGWMLWLWGAALAVVLARERRAPSLVVWAFVLGGLLLDDAMLGHERLGSGLHEVVGRWLGPWAEFLVLCAFGAVALGAVGIAMRFARRADRGIHGGLVVLLAVAAAFGAGVDVVHSLLRHTPFDAPLTVVEQLGEHLAVLMVVVALLAWIARAKVPPSRVPASAPRAASVQCAEHHAP